MSEEEKNAFENLENIVEDLEDAERGAIINLSQEEINGLKLILSLVKKQQKEYISKDKIRRLINKVEEEYSNIMNNKEISLETKNIHTYQHNSMITVLKELLEEN